MRLLAMVHYLERHEIHRRCGLLNNQLICDGSSSAFGLSSPAKARGILLSAFFATLNIVINLEIPVNSWPGIDSRAFEQAL